MKPVAGSLRLSASDLSNHLACNHLTTLDLRVAAGSLPIPQWNSPDAWVLRQRGLMHEAAYIEHLRAKGLSIANLQDGGNEKNPAEGTRAAMRAGLDVIVQAVLGDANWFGRADVLRKVASPSALGSWSYEVYDCKLALETKAGTILQLSLYSDLLASIQGIWPEFMHVVPPSDGFVAETYRLLDFAAYYRYVKRRLEKTVQDQSNNNVSYPEPTEHCPVCRWWQECDKQRRRDDHLSLVAGINGLQRKQLSSWEVKTVNALSLLPLPLQRRPERGSRVGYIRVREQARVQVASRSQRRPVFEVLELREEHGFYALPVPSPGDVFFDLEGDPFVDRSGREYLFGFASEDVTGEVGYQCRWAITSEEEKQAFEWFVDAVMAKWAAHPTMHVYHFTGYETGALKRLMGRYATREDEIDKMLRAHLFVDLHAIVKRAVRAGVEQYSLKALEVFHGFERKVSLDDARQAMRRIQHALELGEAAKIEGSIRETVALYNADDCYSTWSLRAWLEAIRLQTEQAGTVLLRPATSDGVPPSKVDERQQRTADLAIRLRNGVPVDPGERDDEQAGRWLLSNLLDWHRRESKSEWFEYYRLAELTDEQLADEKSSLCGLRFIERVGVERKIPTDRYTFDRQQTEIRVGKTVSRKGEKFGDVVAINMAERTIDIKKTKKTAEIHPDAVYINDIGPSTDVLADAIYRVASWVNDNGMDAPGPYRAGRDLLSRRSPRLTTDCSTLVLANETTVAAAMRLAGALDNSVLAIQGPPGAGKTHAAAQMICQLVRNGKRVGITATSHKVISKLVRDTVAAANVSGTVVRCVQKVRPDDKPDDDPGHIQMIVDNAETLAAFSAGANVLAGTQWLWSQPDLFEAVDVLFVDEAGQMSLANVLAVSQGAKSLILLGDPQQLEQPLKGSHPEGADLSALEHLLDGAKTMRPDRGLFLEKTWRLHPKLCEFTSEAFYEGRLQSQDGLERQRIEGHPWLGEAGLWFIPVRHEGNQNSSPEEVERIANIIGTLTEPGLNWIDAEGRRRPMTLEDILILAPYNAQVSDLADRFPKCSVGTVDKFQGQEGPVVIYSLTTSSPEDAPRGMEFLYSLNRLNVATSRARAMVIVVGSPRLLEPECRSPRQMRLANALCRYVELARVGETAAKGAN